MSNDVLETILTLIRKKGVTEKECLKQCGINTSFLTDWKNGRIKNPSYDKLVKIAQYLDVSLDYLLLGKGENEVAEENKVSLDYSKERDVIKTSGELIREIRNSLNLSLRKFGDKCGLSHSYISKLEKGVDPKTGTPVSPSIDTIRQICTATNYPLEKFLYETGYITTPYDNESLQNIDRENEEAKRLINLLLTGEESELLDDFSTLSDSSKKELEKYVELLKLKDIQDRNKDTMSLTSEQSG